MSTDTAALLALASRVEAGERYLSPDIWAAAGWEVRRHARWGYAIREVGASHWQSTPRLTSLDAIESLRRRVLPGWCIWRLREMPNGTWLCLKRRANTDRENGFAPTIAQAYCAAVLRAVAANKETSQ